MRDQIVDVDDLRGMLDDEILAVVQRLQARVAELEAELAALRAACVLETDAVRGWPGRRCT